MIPVQLYLDDGRTVPTTSPYVVEIPQPRQPSLVVYCADLPSAHLTVQQHPGAILRRSEDGARWANHLNTFAEF